MPTSRSPKQVKDFLENKYVNNKEKNSNYNKMRFTKEETANENLTDEYSNRDSVLFQY